MFENKWKERALALEQTNQSLTQQLVDISKSSKSVSIVKLYPENTEQFELDGEYVVDPTPAVYRGHNLTFSEEVLFKAGKETAAREYESQLKAYEEQVCQLKSQVNTSTSEISALHQTIDSNNQELFDAKSKITETQQDYENRIKSLERGFSKSTDNFNSTIAELRADKENLMAEVEKWKSIALRAPQISNTRDIVTPCGTIAASTSN